MTDHNFHADKDADRLWGRCRRDANLRWLLEGVLTSRRPELGRILLLSPSEVLGDAHARVGKRLSLRFRLTGFPYLSDRSSILSRTARLMMSARSAQEHKRKTKQSIADWAAANGRQARDLIAAGILETIRQNDALRTLAISDLTVTPVRVAQAVGSYEVLNWTAMTDLIQALDPFLARSQSKKTINHFTLNFAGLLQDFQPDIIQQEIVLRSANQFVRLLKRRAVTENEWRNLLVKLVDLNLVSPNTSVFLWCRKFPRDGFAMSPSFALGVLPPCCPSCGKDAHAMASFAPSGGLFDAMQLKDGVLGAAIGWHLEKRGIRFLHGYCKNGTEMDFIPIMHNGRLLIECKVLGVLSPPKQLARNIRKAIKQLDRHATLLQEQTGELRDSICVVNLTKQNLTALMRSHRASGIARSRLISYEDFPNWLRARTLAYRSSAKNSRQKP